MDLDSLKHGNEFICWWFEEGEANVKVCQWSPEEDVFKCYESDQKVCNMKTDYTYIHDSAKFFSYTTCVSSDGSQVSFDKVK